MKRRGAGTLARAVGAALALLSAAPAPAQQAPPLWVVGFYGGWMQDHLPPSEIDYDALTRVIHFALWPLADGSVDRDINSLTPANVASAVQAAHAAGKPIVIGVGGWTSRAAFLSAFAPARRAAFIENIVSFMASGGYDGVDINMERLEAVDEEPYVAFILALRARLDLFPVRKTLTVSTFWQPRIFARLTGALDQINVTTYNISGTYPGWVTWHHGPIFNGGRVFPSNGLPLPSAETFIQDFLDAGIPAAKLGLGLTYYGNVWAGGAGTDTGGASRPVQSWTTAPVVTKLPYFELARRYGLVETGALHPAYVWDVGAAAPYLGFDEAGAAGDAFVSYDDARSAREKVAFARARGLGGLIIWELGGGYRPELPAGQRDLLLQAVKGAAQQNAAADPLAAVRAYPVPYRPSGGDPEQGRPYQASDPQSGVIFDRLPPSAAVVIYSLTSRRLRRLEASGGVARWDARDEQGREVGSGGYLAVIEAPGAGSTLRRLLIVR